MNNRAEQVIAVKLFDNMISSVSKRLEDTVQLKINIKYHSKSLNQSLSSDFSQITEVLQSTVDKLYWDAYQVDHFVPFSLADFDHCLSHNKQLLGSCQKLLKFVG